MILTAGDAGEDTFLTLRRGLVQYLALVAKMKRTCANTIPKFPFRYASTEEFVLFDGQCIDAVIDNCGYPAMRAGNCFANAFTLAIQHPNLRYHEGWGYMEQSIPTHHAWVVDDSGAVHDPTWLTVVQGHRNAGTLENWNKTRCVYVGVHVPLDEHLAWYEKHGTMNLLSHGEIDHQPVLAFGKDAFRMQRVAADMMELTKQATLSEVTGAPCWEIDPNGDGRTFIRRQADGSISRWRDGHFL